MFAQAWVDETADDAGILELCNEFPNAGYAILPLRLHPRSYIGWLETGLKAAGKLRNKEYEGYHLGNLGNAYAALGDARKAIEFYEQALAIDREIGDRRGEGNALANMGMAHKNLGDRGKARQLWQEALAIYRAIESPHTRTVEGWLAGLDGEEPEKTEMSLRDFVRAVVQAHRSKASQAAQIFDALGKMAADETAPPELRELAKVLRSFMSGVKNPDLSGLPEELAGLVREEFEKD